MATAWPWDDEALAGTMIPGTRRATPGRILANAMRAEQEATSARRREERVREESPEAVEEEWRAAYHQARMEMRRERLQGRLVAGMETPVSATERHMEMCEEFVEAARHVVSARDLAVDIHLSPFGAKDFSIPFAAMHKAIQDRILSEFAIPSYMIPSVEATQEEQVRKLAEMSLQAGFNVQPDTQALARIIDALGTPSAQLRKPPPPREHYLPGTRYAGKRRRSRPGGYDEIARNSPDLHLACLALWRSG
jgi:hypothetical protein